MGWNYEVEEVQEIRVWSREDMEQKFLGDIKNSGIKSAISNMTKQFIEIAEQVRNVKKEKKIELCDRAFGLITSSAYTILRALSEELDERIKIEAYDFSTDNNGNFSVTGDFGNNAELRIKNMLAIAKKPIDESAIDLYLEIQDLSNKERNKMKQEMLAKERAYQRKKVEYLSALLNVKNGKSLFKIYYEQINILINIYCKETKKDESIMKMHIYSTIKDVHSAYENERDTFGGFFQSIALGINSAKRDRITEPFTYFLDVNC